MLHKKDRKCKRKRTIHMKTRQNRKIEHPSTMSNDSLEARNLLEDSSTFNLRPDPKNTSLKHTTKTKEQRYFNEEVYYLS